MVGNLENSKRAVNLIKVRYANAITRQDLLEGVTATGIGYSPGNWGGGYRYSDALKTRMSILKKGKCSNRYPPQGDKERKMITGGVGSIEKEAFYRTFEKNDK